MNVLEHRILFMVFIIGTMLMIYATVCSPGLWYKLWFADAVIMNGYFAWKHRPRRK